uniref:Uncharacterized protein n=1 Tax=Panagrolaimus sp. ES5 TaxID=591445 RepID=A0AC34FNN8_9BILA
MMSTESKCRALLVRLSCDKLLKVRRSPDVLKRQIQILSVLKHAHDENARFEPECSYLLEKRAPRLVVTFEQAPIQRISPSTSSPSSTSTSSSTSMTNNAVDREVPSSPVMEQVEFDEQECIEEDGGSMARKRKNHSKVDAVSSEKRHCDKEFSHASASSSTASNCSNSF